MKWYSVFALAGLVWWQMPALAAHARIDLRIFRLDKGAGANQSDAQASADHEPPPGGANPRPLLQVKVNEPLALQFILTNVYPHGERKGVTVRYFVVRASKGRAEGVTDVSEGTVTQGRFKMNFKPGCQVGARVQFRLPERGVYLLRVETLNTQSDHEHFAAIDLQAE